MEIEYPRMKKHKGRGVLIGVILVILIAIGFLFFFLWLFIWRHKKPTPTPAIPIENQPPKTIQIVNGTNDTLWINWTTSEPSQGPMTKAWNAKLKTAGIPYNSWQNDSIGPLGGHAMGLFQLNIGQSVILEYMGISSRIAPVVGCTGDLSQSVVSMAWMKQYCTGSTSGTPSPQTLVEWTYSADPITRKGDVIDSSSVDGFSLPLKIEYKKQTPPNTYTTILGNLDLNKCDSIGGKVVGVSCQSPCSQYPNTPELCCTAPSPQMGVICPVLLPLPQAVRLTKLMEHVKNALIKTFVM